MSTPAFGGDPGKCPHALVAGKVGLILGMMSRLQRDSIPWAPIEPNALDVPVDYDATASMLHWGPELPLPCLCRTCFEVYDTGVSHGRNYRIRTENFARFKDPFLDTATISAAVNSKLNQAIVSLLPTLYKRLAQ